MKRNRSFVRMLGVGLFLALSPMALAQTTTGTGGGTGGGGGGGTGGGGGATGGTGTGALGGGNTGTTTQPAAAVAGVATLTQKANVYSAKGGTPTATTIPSLANFMANSFVIPQSLGMPSLYTSQYGAQNVITSTGGPTGKFTYLYVAPPTAAAAAAATPSTTPLGFNTYNVPRAPVYMTVLSEDVPMPKHEISTVLPKVRQDVANSEKFRDKVQVGLDGDTIVLTGVVRTATERQVAEGYVRMTPGVNSYNVQNNLQVAVKN